MEAVDAMEFGMEAMELDSAIIASEAPVDAVEAPEAHCETISPQKKESGPNRNECLTPPKMKTAGRFGAMDGLLLERQRASPTNQGTSDAASAVSAHGKVIVPHDLNLGGAMSGRK